MRLNILLFVVFIISTKAFSQGLGGEVQSVSATDQILNKVKLLSGSYPDSAIAYAREGLVLARKEADAEALGVLYFNLAALYGKQANYPISLAYVDSALQWKDYVKDKII